MKLGIYFFIILVIMKNTVFAYEPEKDIPTVNARSAILYDSTYDRILYDKNSKQKRANASTTKMVTALVAVEHGNLNDIVTVSDNAANIGGSNINLKSGDKISLDDLIKGLLIHSGNDAAVAIAEHISDSVSDFAIMMNEKLIEIGVIDTCFKTPHGLDAENHYSTAYDLAIIAKNILANDYLASIVSSESAIIEINGVKKEIHTTNEMFLKYEGINGIKTGYTGKAGRCLVTSCLKSNRQLICVVLGCDTKENRTNDTIKLLNYGFHEYSIVNIGKYIKENIYITVEKSIGEIYRYNQEIDFYYPLKEIEKGNITIKYDIKKELIAPLSKNERVGSIKIELNGIQIGQISLVLPQKISRKNWKEYFKKVFTESLKNTEYLIY